MRACTSIISTIGLCLVPRLLTHGSYPQCVNVWRAQSNSLKLRDAYTELWGQEESDKVLRRLPPRPLRGRWGSLTGAEAALLKCGQKRLAPAFSKAFIKALSASRKSESAQSDIVLIEDDLESFSERMGRWTRETLADVHDAGFWVDMVISITSRGPIAHMQNWLQDKRMEGKMFELVWTKGTEIASEFDRLLDANALHTVWMPQLDDLLCDEDQVTDFVTRAVTQTLEMCVDYQRRILSKLRQFPCLLLWLVWKEHNCRCEERMRLCNDLLTQSEQEIGDATTLKLRRVFRAEIEVAARTGLLHQGLFNLLKHLGRLWLTDTQAIEGTNNVVKHIGALAPSISWELLSARVLVKKHLAQIPQRRDQETLVQACVGAHESIHQSLADDAALPVAMQRFAVVSANTYPLPKSSLLLTRAVLMIQHGGCALPNC